MFFHGFRDLTGRSHHAAMHLQRKKEAETKAEIWGVFS